MITQQPLTVRRLISAGANVNLPDRNGQTAVHLACQRSDLVCLKQLMCAQTPEIANCEVLNFDGFKPLHLAVFADSVELINCLVENGADVNCKVRGLAIIFNYTTTAAWLAQLVRRQSAVREARARFPAGTTLRVLK